MSEYNSNVLHWLQTILCERFGCIFLLSQPNDDHLKLSLPEGKGAIYFDSLVPYFFSTGPDIPYSEWNPEDEKFSAILNRPLPAPGNKRLTSPVIEMDDEDHFIHYDILGLVYWMLSRQEEVGETALDCHGRFPGTSSHAYRHGYLDRPVVDEWLDILGQVITRQWPKLKLKKHLPRTMVTCDVDSPYLSYSKSLRATVLSMAGDVVKRRSFKGAIRRVYRYIQFQSGNYDSDPHFKAIDWIMEINELAGNTVAFYFIPEQRDPLFDSFYSLDEPVIRVLMQRISARGHEIGLHASYTTYRDINQTVSEADQLRRVMHEEGIDQLELGGRQHYLRWEVPATAQCLENAGMTYDSTLGYADCAGFRCGTCHEFPMFDPVEGKSLSLRQRPLILMESSVISDVYMGLGYSSESLDYMKELKTRCHQVGGVFTLLWHNSHFTSSRDKNFYRALIE